MRTILAIIAKKVTLLTIWKSSQFIFTVHLQVREFIYYLFICIICMKAPMTASVSWEKKSSLGSYWEIEEWHCTAKVIWNSGSNNGIRNHSFNIKKWINLKKNNNKKQIRPYLIPLKYSESFHITEIYVRIRL